MIECVQCKVEGRTTPAVYTVKFRRLELRRLCVLHTNEYKKQAGVVYWHVAIDKVFLKE